MSDPPFRTEQHGAVRHVASQALELPFWGMVTQLKIVL
jgi:hypothetical protein